MGAEAGLLSASFAASVRASSDDAPGGEGDALPDTGGPTLSALLLCASAALLIAGVLVARRVAG